MITVFVLLIFLKDRHKLKKSAPKKWFIKLIVTLNHVMRVMRVIVSNWNLQVRQDKTSIKTLGLGQRHHLSTTLPILRALFAETNASTRSLRSKFTSPNHEVREVLTCSSRRTHSLLRQSIRNKCSNRFWIWNRGVSTHSSMVM